MPGPERRALGTAAGAELDARERRRRGLRNEIACVPFGRGLCSSISSLQTAPRLRHVHTRDRAGDVAAAHDTAPLRRNPGGGSGAPWLSVGL